MKKFGRILLFLVSLAGLVGVRAIQDVAYYDPFIDYFRYEGLRDFPQFEWGKLILSHLFRYGLNILFSCGIVYALFQKRAYVGQTIMLMLIAALIFFPLYFWAIGTEMKVGQLLTFYLRRFVIQPLILLLVIPIFYFKEKRLTAES